MTEPTERNYEQDIAYILSSFTDGGINSSFELYSKIQQKIGQYQNMSFASNVEDCFKHPEVEGD